MAAHNERSHTAATDRGVFAAEAAECLRSFLGRRRGVATAPERHTANRCAVFINLRAVVVHSGMAIERVTADPSRMGGLPTIRDTRMTVGMVLGQLATGRAIEEVLRDYPYLDRDDVLAALEYGAALANEREVPVAQLA